MKKHYPLQVWAAVNFLPPAIIAAATLLIEGVNVYGFMVAGGLLCYTLPLSLPLLLINKYFCRQVAESYLPVQTAKFYIMVVGWVYIALATCGLFLFVADFKVYIVFAAFLYAVLQTFASACFKLREKHSIPEELWKEA